MDGGILPSASGLDWTSPYFSTLKDTSSVQVRSGQRLLVGIHKVPEEEQKMEVFILRLRAERAGAVK